MHWTHRILSIFPSFDVGGAQRRYLLLANAFAPMKLPRLEHLIVAMDGNTTATRRFSPEVRWRTIKEPGRKGHLFSNIFAYRALIDELRPDLVITHNWGSIEWALANTFTDVRHVHVEDGFSSQEAEHQLPRRVWFRRLALAGKEIIVPGKGLEHAARKIWKAPKSEVERIQNGIDVYRFRDHVDPPISLPAGAFIIGTMAALRPEKNLGMLIHAFKLMQQEFKNAFLLIGGVGEEMDSLKKIAADAEIGHRVHFLGHIAEPANIVPCFDVLAMSSLTEQVPMSIIEAMASCKPILSTDVGDIKEMVCPENKPFIEGVHHAEQLAKNLLFFAQNPLLRDEIGHKNRVVAAADYTLLEMQERWLDVFLRDVDVNEITLPKRPRSLTIIEE